MLSVFPAICHLYFPLLQNKTHLMTHLKDTVFVLIYSNSQRLRHYSVNGMGRQRGRYPDTIVDDAFLGILVIFFLRVNANPVGCQVLPYLSKGSKSENQSEKAPRWCARAGQERGVGTLSLSNSRNDECEKFHPLFELLPLLNGERVSFGNDRYDADDSPQPLHKFNVNGA